MARVISGLTPAFEGEVRLDGKALSPDVKHRDKKDKLLEPLQERLDTAFVFISHDLSTVASFANRIVVLYAGRVAEQGPTQRILSPPHHPYTRLLLNSVPEMRTGWLEDHRSTREAEQAMADVVNIGLTGCPFHTRCPLMIPGTCDVEKPPVHRLEQDHRIARHRDIGDLLEAPVLDA